MLLFCTLRYLGVCQNPFLFWSITLLPLGADQATYHQLNGDMRDLHQEVTEIQIWSPLPKPLLDDDPHIYKKKIRKTSLPTLILDS